MSARINHRLDQIALVQSISRLTRATRFSSAYAKSLPLYADSLPLSYAGQTRIECVQISAFQ